MVETKNKAQKVGKSWYVLSTREWLMGGIGLALGTVAVVPLLSQSMGGPKGVVIQELDAEAPSGVVARTEIGRKETTVIEVLEEKPEGEEVASDTAATDKTYAGLKEDDLRNLKTVLHNLDAEREELIKSLKTMSQATLSESARVQQVITLVNTLQNEVVAQAQTIEKMKNQDQQAFGEKVQDLGLIFLGQQLVVLDNAYTRGDVTVPALKNVEAFARNVAAQPEIANTLAELTKMAEVGVITRLSLIAELEAALAKGEPVAKVPTPQNAKGSLWERLQERANQWVKVRKIDAGAPAEGLWLETLSQVHQALVTGRDDKALELLNEEVLAQDERLNTLRAHLSGYIDQKTLLSTAQNHYYSLYRP